MFRRFLSTPFLSHGSPALLGRLRRGLRRTLQPLRRLSHSLSSPNDDQRLGFVSRELDQLQSLIPTTRPPAEQARGPEEEATRGGGPRRVEIIHPWPEWTDLIDRLLARGCLDRSAFDRSPSSSLNASKDSNHIRTACLNFARDRAGLIRYLSRRDIRIVVGSGCPSLDRKVVNSGKRLRAHVGIEEGDVCSSCNLRGGCERAYMKAHEDESGRTVDIMRILLTYGLDLITGSVENQACLTKIVKESVRKLLSEMVDLDIREVDSATPLVASSRASSGSSRNQMSGSRTVVPMRQGDWICPKCNFLNFAKNIKCLCCNGVFPERLKKLRDGSEHLPLKRGDWICEKCNFLNFAKNTKCLQCHEKPHNRHLNPGEWECVSCNYVNFRKNMMCLKCDWKRPKASVSGDIAAESQCDKQGQRDEGRNFWSSEDDDCDDDEDDSGERGLNEFDKFPIVGGKGATSRDPLMRESWKEEMSRRARGVWDNSFVGENNGDARFSSVELDDYSGEDEVAGWFRYQRDGLTNNK